MTLMGAINHLDAVKPNGYGQVEKIKWLSNLDGRVKAEIIDTHEGGDGKKFSGYDETTALTQELLIPFPYDEVYIRWLEAQIDYANGEYGKYNNSITLFNTAYTAYEKFYNKTHRPLQRGSFGSYSSGGDTPGTNGNQTVIPSTVHITEEDIAKIANAVAERVTVQATSARIGYVTLLASKWVASGSYYSQKVTVNGVTKNSQVDLTPSVDQLDIFHDKDLAFVTENDNGVVTVYAIGQKPTNDYTIQVTITEVAV
jgi:hypothetical protein